MPRQKELSEHPLVTVGRVKANLLPRPVFRCLRLFYSRVQFPFIVRIQCRVGLEDIVRDGFVLREVASGDLYVRCRGSGGWRVQFD